MLLRQIRPALVLLVLFTALTGIIYPLAITGFAAVIFPNQARGSLVERNGTVVGSSLIGQNFTSARYFHSRPSATSSPDPQDPAKTVDAPYNAASSAGSNLGPLSQKLMERVKADIEEHRKGGATGPLPADSVTASGSGLDPHISPANALVQIASIAAARGLPEDEVRRLVEAHTDRRSLGFLGERRVNVLLLNLGLDALRSP